MVAEPRERPLHELLSRDMVDIYVGQENTHWILHEKLLCHRSKFFRDIFYKQKKGQATRNTAYGLPDEDDEPFRLFVGWLYADSVPAVRAEKDLAPLLDLYLMGEKWGIAKLAADVLETVRRWYHDSDTWPGLRRVQYVYAGTNADSPLRLLLVQCVARMLVLGDGVPAHWEKALRNNGQLATDIIMCVQKWHVGSDNVPDARSESVGTMVEDMEEMKMDVKRDGESEVSGNVEEEFDEGQEEQPEEV